MAGFDNVYITTAGAELAVKTLEGKELAFSVAQLGSGTISDSSVTAIKARTALANKVMEVDITKVSQTSDTQATISFLVKNTDADSAFYFRELGIFAVDPDTKDEVLFAYAYAGDSVEYINNSVSEIVEKTINVVVTVDNAEEVTITLDDTQTYVTETELQEAIEEAVSSKCNVYGVKRKVNDNTSAAWTRIYDSEDLTANATHDGSEVENDFDDLYPWSDIISYNYDVTNKVVNAYYGDATYAEDGSNGEVLTKIPEFYWKRYIEDGYEYILIADYAKAGFNKSEEFSIGRYDACIDDDGALHSYSGYSPSTNKTIIQHRAAAKLLSDEFCLLDWHYFLIQMLYVVEYAHNNSQSKLGNGIVSMRYNASDVAIIAGTSTNVIVIDTNSNFVEGQQIDIASSSVSGRDIAQDRTITSIDDYSSGTTEGTAITFDGDAVDIEEGYIVHSCGQKSGGCDDLGMLSGCLANDNKTAVSYRGIENIFGNVYNWVDGINISDYQAYICYDSDSYASDTFDDPYEKLGYTNCETSDSYILKTGYDEKNPAVSLPIEVEASSTTGYCDKYYCASGNKVIRVGGTFHHGTNAGLWTWIGNNASSNSNINYGARLLILKITIIKLYFTSFSSALAEN